MVLDTGAAVLYILLILAGYTVLLAIGGYFYILNANARQKRRLEEAKEEKLLAQKAKVMEQAGKVASSKNTAKQGAEFMRKSVLIRTSAGKEKNSGKKLSRKKSFFEEVASVGRCVEVSVIQLPFASLNSRFLVRLPGTSPLALEVRQVGQS